jgi:hypothetical protein
MGASTKQPTRLCHVLFLSYRVLPFPESSARTGQAGKHLCTTSERNCRTPRRVPQRNTPHDCENICSVLCVRPSNAVQRALTVVPSVTADGVPTAQGADNWQQFIWPLLEATVVRRLTTGIRSEKCVVWRFRRRANVTECTYTNLDSIAFYTPSLFGIAYCS